MVRSYLSVLKAPSEKINGEIFNVGFRNQTVNELAEDVRTIIGEDVKILKTTSEDNRSYHVSNEKIKTILGFEPKFTIQDAVKDLKLAFDKKLIPDSFEDKKYFNIKTMNSIKLV